MGQALQTDLYELTMAAAYFREGSQHRRAVCEAFVRRLPKKRNYLIAAGLERVLAFLEDFHFTKDEVDYLASVPALAEGFRVPGFREHLLSLRFEGDVWAVPEGTAIFGGEPMLRVEAPLIQAQIVETFLLSALNHETTIATKAARIAHVASPAAVMEFGARRAHPEAAVDVARAAYVGGCVGTSNLEAGRRFGIPVFGTAAHMFIMAHGSEVAAFQSYVETFPTTTTLLIDTYDTLEGARRAAAVGGPGLRGVRLDSGDFLELSREVRRILDTAGLHQVKIVASGDLNETKIRSLVQARAPIDLYGVGTDLVISRDEPALGGIYKLVAIERDGRLEPTAKFSEAKVTWPGAKQIFRHVEGGRFVEDELGLAGEVPPLGAVPLLVPVMKGGRRIAPPESLDTLRERTRASLASLPPWVHDLGPDKRPCRYEVRPTKALVATLAALRAKMP